MKIPDCVISYIRSLGPSEDGTYKGHCDGVAAAVKTEEEDTKAMGCDQFDVCEENTSFKDVKDEATPKPVDFEARESVQLAVHFHNKRFDAENIRSFVVDSPVEGWVVNFRPNPFSSATIVCKDRDTYNKLSIYCFSHLKECTKFTCNKI